MADEQLWALLLLFVVPLAALVAVVATVMVLVGFLRRFVGSGRWPDLITPGMFANLSVGALSAATLTYYYGYYKMPWFDIDDYCPTSASFTKTATPFRLSAVCGSRPLADYVPGWVNPTSLVLTVCSVLCAATAVALTARRSEVVRS